MEVNPVVPLMDVTRFCLAYLLLRYVNRMERSCVGSNLPFNDWRSLTIRLYCLLTFVFILISLFMESSNDLAVIQLIINGPLGLFVLIALFTYVRDLEDEIKNCDLTKDAKYLHEFWKFYSLVTMILLLFMVFVVISSIVSALNLPKHVSIQKMVNKMTEEMNKSLSKKSNNSSKSGKSNNSTKSGKSNNSSKSNNSIKSIKSSKSK